MKKILIVLPNDALGGAEQILKMLAEYHKKDRIDIFFFKRKMTNQWENTGNNENVTLKYFNVGSEYLGSICFLFEILFKSREKYTFVYTSHVFITGIIGLLIRLKLISKDYFVARESTLIFQRFKGFKLFLYKLMYKTGYASVDLLICQTVQMKMELLKALPWLENSTKIEVIPNPIDLELILLKSTANANDGIEKYGDYIVSAGRLIPEKGYDILIHAFYKVKQDYKSLKLVVLGEGKEKTSLINQINELGLEEDVFLIGFVENVYPYFRSAKLCAVSSRIEGFPNVLLQMMSQNKNVVSTKCAGGIDEIPGVCIAETDDVESLKEAILKSLNSQNCKVGSEFDIFLKERSIDNFIVKIEYFLNIHNQ
ncbi:glycosyltransferase [Flavobacterium sp.]|uniref:glycosyltransferase n=1 Tax=Flavobacterium sp. TaxID=239 RepID=UPI002B4AE8F6|nr:glycosyltransferase [Flavobacterium sp.]HLF51187.1 glycosyltransferase [Flavobacterium sp.]